MWRPLASSTVVVLPPLCFDWAHPRKHSQHFTVWHHVLCETQNRRHGTLRGPGQCPVTRWKPCVVCWPVSVQPVVCFRAEDVRNGRGAWEFCGQEGRRADGEKGEREREHTSDSSMEIHLALLYFKQRFQVMFHVASMNCYSWQCMFFDLISEPWQFFFMFQDSWHFYMFLTSNISGCL